MVNVTGSSRTRFIITEAICMQVIQGKERVVDGVAMQQVGWPVNQTGPTPFITTSLPFAIAIDPLFIHDPCDGWPKLPPFCSSLFLLL